MNTRSFFIVTISLLILSAVIAGCLSDTPPVREMSPSLTSTSADKTRELAIGDSAIISSTEGSLEVIVRGFNATTGKILVEEKNMGTDTFRYSPIIWLQDKEGVNYTTVYCHADRCPDFVFWTTLPPQFTEKRDLDNLYDTFHVPERRRNGKLIFYWSNYGHEASWIIIPP